jgi:hypothetical protein
MSPKPDWVERASNPKDRLSWCALLSYPFSECCSLVVPTAADWKTFFEQIHGHSRQSNGSRKAS